MNWRILSMLLIAAVAVMSSACASQLPKYAPKMETVKVKTNVKSKVASVNMNKKSSSSSTTLGKMVDAADTATTVGAGVKIKKKLNRNIDVQYVHEQTQASIEEQLADGPPFGVAEDAGDGRLEINVLSWGMERKDSTPVFVFTLEPEVFYMEQPDSIYSTQHYCDATEGIWATSDESFSLGDNLAVMEYIDKMSDEEFKAAFRRSLDACVSKVVAEMQEEAKEQ